LIALGCSITALAISTPASLADDTKNLEGPALTVYSTAQPDFDPKMFLDSRRGGPVDAFFAREVPGFAVIREGRSIELSKGLGEIRFTDVAAYIDPTSVSFRDLTARGTQVLEQNFEFDLVSPAKLLAKYVDREITLHFDDRESVPVIRGRLLSAAGNTAVLETGDGIQIVPTGDARISMGELPGGLITKPTLVWKLNAATGGTHQIETSYQTRGLTWRADYNLTLNGDDTEGSINSWVTLLNISGSSYSNARLKLVAGDVQLIRPSQMNRARGMMMAEAAAYDSPPTGFQEESFFEYHLYTLPRRTDIKSNGTQQITLFPPVNGFKVVKELLYRGSGLQGASWGREPVTNRGYGAGSGGDVEVFIEFENERDNGLGIPMPAGKIRIFKTNPNDGALEFLGEDLIGHTPRNETIRVKTGDAFDVIGERTQVDFKLDKSRRTMTETWSIEIRNQKSVVQQVTIEEPMYRWRTWEITDSSVPFTKVDARNVRWQLDVEPEGSGTVVYTVKYTW